MSFNRSLFSSASGEWETPSELFNALDAEFHFTLDACASPDKAKCTRYYSERALEETWAGIVWVNPPYGRLIGQWTRKGRQSAEAGATVVMLLPSRTDTKWWHEDVMRSSEIRFIRGRLKFGGAMTGAPFPSAVVIFRSKEEARDVA